jgi:CelD/BcsL family acetyltransferase involved in cellulose biosynthesis
LSDYRVESCVIEHLEDIKHEWSDLQLRASYSYFQSWGWIGTWLEQIAIDLHPVAVRVWLNGELVGLGVFVSRDIKRRIMFHSRAMFLNEYPFDGRNMVIEYNGMLAAEGHEDAVTIEAARYLLRKYREHDEFCFGAIAEQLIPFSPEGGHIEGVNYLINEESTCWYVDLTSFAVGIEGYLASLSRNRRGQIRRSIRVYDQDGSLQIEEAHNSEQALLYLDRLKVLHSEYWQLKGESGSFANPRWESFHRALIHKRFDSGEVQLLKVSSSYGEIGYIYNVVLHKRVYVMQTGFARSEDKHMMPGYVAHTVAIAYNKSKGMTVYDLMHGDALYKRILCNQSQKLLWVVLQRKRLKFVVENLAVSMVRCFKRFPSCKS